MSAKKQQTRKGIFSPPEESGEREGESGEPKAESGRPPSLGLEDVRLRPLPPGAHVCRHVEVQFRLARDEDRRRAETVAELSAALDRAGARLIEGRRVASNADVIRWLLDHLPLERNDD